MKKQNVHIALILLAIAVLAAGVGLLLFKTSTPSVSIQTNTNTDLEDPNRIVDGIHLRTGLKDADGLMSVVTNCTACHSAEIILQNRMDKEGWATTIKWMQETQNLWDLGGQESVIINYLTTNYPPKKKGRREILENIEWYNLEQ